MKDPKEELVRLANTKMPFGKYKGRFLVELPDAYFVWFRQKGFPPGEIGQRLQEMHEIKINGLEKLIYPLVKK